MINMCSHDQIEHGWWYRGLFPEAFARFKQKLVAPEPYEVKRGKWSFAHLPVIPPHFDLRPIEKNADRLKLLVKLIKRKDVTAVVNACDAGREGELIFRYIVQHASAKKPIERLWLQSMTTESIREGFKALRSDKSMLPLADAAMCRSESDWLVGINGTRAMTAFNSKDGGFYKTTVGRVQTPTLAILVERENRIKAFVPRDYWEVFGTFEGKGGRYTGRWFDEKFDPKKSDDEHARAERLWDVARAEALRAKCLGQPGVVTEESKPTTQSAPLLYDLTSLQREANTRHGFSARRTLAAAQKLYEEHTALTYPRTNSRFITGDMVPDIKPTAELVGARPEYAKAAAYVAGLDVLPLARVVNDAKVTDHHAIIPTRAEHDPAKWGEDEKKVYDLVARRFLAVFHPDAVFEQTSVETTVAEHVFRTRGRVLVVPGWRAAYGEEADADAKPAGPADEDDAGREQRLPRLALGEEVQTREIESAEKETKPPRRYSDASLLGAMETAGKLVDDDEAREAMKESGIGTPATRAAIIERLISVGYVERDGRSLVCTEKGLNVIRLLGEHPLTSPGLTGEWEHRLALIEAGAEPRDAFMDGIVKFTGETVAELDAKLKDVRIPRANLGPCPVCGRDIVENRKGYSCWSREDPGCGFVIWKAKAGKTLPASVARELIQTGRTAKQVTGFKGRSGRSFRAKLALQQSEEGKWRVEFDEAWAKEGSGGDNLSVGWMTPGTSTFAAVPAAVLKPTTAGCSGWCPMDPASSGQGARLDPPIGRRFVDLGGGQSGRAVVHSTGDEHPSVGQKRGRVAAPGLRAGG